MERLSEEVLIEEIKKRFEENRRALQDLKVVAKKLDALNKKLTESESHKSSFLSHLRNKINNPLTSIMGMAGRIASGTLHVRASASVAQTIYKEAFDLDFQLKNIFAAAEIEAGESVLGLSIVNVASLIRSLIDSFRHKAEQKDVAVEFDPGLMEKTEAGLSFKTDPAKLHRILSNLLANALEHSPSGEKVKIEARRNGPSLNISVENKGPEISDDERSRIFDRFGCIEAGGFHSGHGLGLSVTKALAEILNGKITFSCGGGTGCIFTVSLVEFDGDNKLSVYSGNGNEFIYDGIEEF